MSSTGNVSGGTAYIGGLVGQNYSSPISNCYSTGTVTGSTYTGGLVGYNGSSSISNSYSQSPVTIGAGGYSIGGLVGYSYGSSSISNSYATGNINSGSGRGNLGGLVGVNDSSSNIRINGAQSREQIFVSSYLENTF